MFSAGHTCQPSWVPGPGPCPARGCCPLSCAHLLGSPSPVHPKAEQGRAGPGKGDWGVQAHRTRRSPCTPPLSDYTQHRSQGPASQAAARILPPTHQSRGHVASSPHGTVTCSTPAPSSSPDAEHMSVPSVPHSWPAPVSCRFGGPASQTWLPSRARSPAASSTRFLHSHHPLGQRGPKINTPWSRPRLRAPGEEDGPPCLGQAGSSHTRMKALEHSKEQPLGDGAL